MDLCDGTTVCATDGTTGANRFWSSVDRLEQESTWQGAGEVTGSGKVYQTIVKLIQLATAAERETGGDEAAGAGKLSAATFDLPAGYPRHGFRLGAGWEMSCVSGCELQLVFVSAAERDSTVLVKGPRSRDTQCGFEKRKVPGGGFHVRGKAFRANEGAVYAAGGRTTRSKETWFALRCQHFAIELKSVEDPFHCGPHFDTRKRGIA
jgi:hypothetical protein